MASPVSQSIGKSQFHESPSPQRNTSFCTLLGKMARKVASTVLNTFVESASKFVIENFITNKKKPPSLDLYYACKSGDLAQARIWMARGSNPYQMHEGKNAFFYAWNNLQLLKILTRTENAPAFRNCKTVHDFWDKVFPHLTDVRDFDHERLMKLLPSDPAWEGWLKVSNGQSMLLAEKMPTIAELVEVPKRLHMSLDDAISFWRSKHPLFAEVFKLANEPKTHHVDQLKHGFEASYSLKDHRIEIAKCETYEELLERLFFESFNALQKRSFDAIVSLRDSGQLTREEYVYLNEWIEYRGLIGRFVLLNHDMDPPPSWPVHWENLNKLHAGHIVSHANHHRKGWDCEAWAYVAQNRRSFEARLAQLRSQS